MQKEHPNVAKYKRAAERMQRAHEAAAQQYEQAREQRAEKPKAKDKAK
jgi:hypothetical protein